MNGFDGLQRLLDQHVPVALLHGMKHGRRSASLSFHHRPMPRGKLRVPPRCDELERQKVGGSVTHKRAIEQN
jgi:hypothetical protein